MNGAGKTTASYTILPEILNCREFVSSRKIARGLSPFRPETVAPEAERIMLNRVGKLMTQQVDFAFEATLSISSYLGLIDEARSKGYSVAMFFCQLDFPDQAEEHLTKGVSEQWHGAMIGNQSETLQSSASKPAA